MGYQRFPVIDRFTLLANFLSTLIKLIISGGVGFIVNILNRYAGEQMVYRRDGYLYEIACVFALYATRDMNNVIGARMQKQQMRM